MLRRASPRPSSSRRPPASGPRLREPCRDAERRGGRVLFGQPDGNVTGQQVGADPGRCHAGLSGNPSVVSTVDRERRRRPTASWREVLACSCGQQQALLPQGATWFRLDDCRHARRDSGVSGTRSRLRRSRTVTSTPSTRTCVPVAGRAFDAGLSDVLRALGLLDSDDRPNRGAVALFGRSDTFAGQYPTLGYRLVAVASTELGEQFLDDVLVEENLFSSLRRAMSFCDQHLHHPVRIGGGLRAEVRRDPY